MKRANLDADGECSPRHGSSLVDILEHLEKAESNSGDSLQDQTVTTSGEQEEEGEPRRGQDSKRSAILEHSKIGRQQRLLRTVSFREPRNNCSPRCPNLPNDLPQEMDHN